MTVDHSAAFFSRAGLRITFIMEYIPNCCNPKPANISYEALACLCCAASRCRRFRSRLRRTGVSKAVDTENHLIVAHEVTTSGSDRSQLANIAQQAKAILEADTLDVVADRGYFKGEEILACEQSGITVTLPKPMTSGAKASGRFGKQDFAYLPDEDVYRCPAGKQLKYYYTSEEDGQKLRNYWTNACKTCPLKSKCTPSPQRRIKRWVHEDVLERAQARLDKNPNAMRTRRETVEHPFGTLKMRIGATHFLCVTLPKVATEMALCVLGYNLTRVLNIVGMKPLLAAVRA
ncbi:transposase [Bradyrhizobium sp. 144]|nr:transposase [Bradyrhizobium sp. 144]